MIDQKSPRPLRLGAHLPALDGLRGIAILLVVIYHAMLFPRPLQESDPPIDRFVNFWARGGWFGVDLFFVLSGFLITGILYESKGSGSYFRTFYARRILRIFPVYYAVLTVLLVVLPKIPYIQGNFESLAGDEIWYWLYLSNYSLGIAHAEMPRRLDYFWSLAVEEQFYLIWPLVVLLLDRRRLMVVCGAVVGAVILWRTSLVLLGAHPVTVFALTPSRVDGLAVGAFIALAVRGGDQSVSRLLRWARPVSFGAALGVIGIALGHRDFGPYTVGMQTVGYTFLALGYGAVLVLTVCSRGGSWAVGVLGHPSLRMFGRYSYAMYLFHVPLMFILEKMIFRSEQFPMVVGSKLPGQIIFLAVATSVSFLAAWLSWNLYERHFLHLKRFFPYESRVDNPRIQTARVALPADAVTDAGASAGTQIGS